MDHTHYYYQSNIEKFGVLGAGSVLTKNVKENTMFAGNPAKYIKKKKSS